VLLYSLSNYHTCPALADCQIVFFTVTTTAFETGVLLFFATLFTGTSTLASGK
jgi:hypothetical protein